MAKKQSSVSGKALQLSDLPLAQDFVQFEKNLLQYGIFGANENRAKSLVLERTVGYRDAITGVQKKITFRAVQKYGLPTTADCDKWLAFMKMIMEVKKNTGQIPNPFRFGGSSFLRTLGLQDGGANYEAIYDWGMRLRFTGIESNQSIFVAGEKRYKDGTMAIFKDFSRVGIQKEDGSGRIEAFEVLIDDWILHNLNDSFAVLEDHSSYSKLSRPTAKGIFVQLPYWFAESRGAKIEKNYTEVCLLLNIRPYSHASKIREVLGRALNDLIEIGYLMCWDIARCENGEGFLVVLEAGPTLTATLSHADPAFGSKEPSDGPLTPHQVYISDALRLQGVSTAKVRQIINTLAPTDLADRYDYASTQLNGAEKGKFHSPAGFLISVLDGKVPISITYKTLSERNKEADAKEKREAKEELRRKQELRSVLRTEAYSTWKNEQVESEFTRSFSDPQALMTALQAFQRTYVLRDKTKYLDRLTKEKRQSESLRLFKLEFAKKLSLPSFEEWSLPAVQRDLFQNATEL